MKTLNFYPCNVCYFLSYLSTHSLNFILSSLFAHCLLNGFIKKTLALIQHCCHKLLLCEITPSFCFLTCRLSVSLFTRFAFSPGLLFCVSAGSDTFSHACGISATEGFTPRQGLGLKSVTLPATPVPARSRHSPNEAAEPAALKKLPDLVSILQLRPHTTAGQLHSES